MRSVTQRRLNSEVKPIPKYNGRPCTNGALFRHGVRLRQGAQAERPLLSVVDDDESVRESLPDLLREFGFAARAFSSAEEFLSSDCLDQTTLPDPRHRDAGHEWTGASAGIEASPAGDSDHLHHRSAQIRLFARDYSNRVQSSACSSHSATRLCLRQLIRHFNRSERLGNSVDYGCVVYYIGRNTKVSPIPSSN